MLSVAVYCRLLVLILTVTASCTIAANNTLTFLYMTGFTGLFLSSGTLPAVDMALERINSDPSVLSGYELRFVVEDAQCSRSPSLKNFLNFMLYNETTVVAILGTGCTTATEPVAEVSPNFGLSQVSYISSGSVLTNLNKFPNLLQVHPPERNIIPGFAATVVFFNWTRLVILTENNIFFTTNQRQLQTILSQKNVTNIIAETFEEGHKGTFKLDQLQNDGYRIFFINGYEDMALHIICEAFNLRLVQPDYVWILYGWYQAEFWTNTSTLNLSCSPAELYSVINNTIGISHYPIAENRSMKARDVGNISYNEFQTLYQERIRNSSYSSAYFAHIAYDSVWVLALALTNSISLISNISLPQECSEYSTPLVPLTQFNYSNSSTACLIRHSLRKVNFTGISGSVNFDENGTRKGTPVRILQYRNGELVQFASYFGVSETFEYQLGENLTTVYPNGIPNDGSPIQIIPTFHLALVIIIYMLTFLGIAFATVCFIFNLAFSKRKIVRLTSPKLNYFIVLGAMMIYIAVIFRVFPSNNIVVWKFICTVPVWLGNIGYTMAFAAILSKMWRIYYIFHNPAPKKRAISDWHMIALIFIITAIMAVIIAVGFAIPQVLPTPVLVNDNEHHNGFDDSDTFIQYMTFQCLGNASIPWQIIIFVYLGGLHITAIVLAVQTRKVKVKALNETKEVTAIIYISSIILVVLIAVSFTVTMFKNISEACITTGLLTITTSFLITIFVPKMWKVYKEPKDERNNSSADINQHKSLNVSVSEYSKIAMLENKIKALESKLTNHVNIPSADTVLDSCAEKDDITDNMED